MAVEISDDRLEAMLPALLEMEPTCEEAAELMDERTDCRELETDDADAAADELVVGVTVVVWACLGAVC